MENNVWVRIDSYVKHVDGEWCNCGSWERRIGRLETEVFETGIDPVLSLMVRSLVGEGLTGVEVRVIADENVRLDLGKEERSEIGGITFPVCLSESKDTAVESVLVFRREDDGVGGKINVVVLEKKKEIIKKRIKKYGK